MNTTAITVLMPVYNGETHLCEAIESVIGQTFGDFEFLIINDGSSDNSEDIIRKYKDPRIRLINNEKNLKLIQTLNKGIAISRGKYIARMDCDDICMPRRLEKQYNLMEAIKDIGVCGTFLETMGKKINSVWKFPVNSSEIKAHLFFNSVIAHPTVMIRKDILVDNNICYNSNFIHCEDYELWLNLSNYTNFYNIDEVLYRYRLHQNQITFKYKDEKNRVKLNLNFSQLKKMCIDYSAEEAYIHQAVCCMNFPKLEEFLKKVENWLMKLKKRNDEVSFFNKIIFSKILAIKWFQVCYKTSILGSKVLDIYYNSQLSLFNELSFFEKIIFFMACKIKLNNDFIEMLKEKNRF